MLINREVVRLEQRTVVLVGRCSDCQPLAMCAACMCLHTLVLSLPSQFLMEHMGVRCRHHIPSPSEGCVQPGSPEMGHFPSTITLRKSSADQSPALTHSPCSGFISHPENNLGSYFFLLPQCPLGCPHCVRSCLLSLLSSGTAPQRFFVFRSRQ